MRECGEVLGVTGRLATPLEQDGQMHSLECTLTDRLWTSRNSTRSTNSHSHKRFIEKTFQLPMPHYFLFMIILATFNMAGILTRELNISAQLSLPNLLIILSQVYRLHLYGYGKQDFFNTK